MELCCLPNRICRRHRLVRGMNVKQVSTWVAVSTKHNHVCYVVVFHLHSDVMEMAVLKLEGI